MTQAEDNIGQVIPGHQIHMEPGWIQSIKFRNFTYQVIIIVGREYTGLCNEITMLMKKTLWCILMILCASLEMG